MSDQSETQQEMLEELLRALLNGEKLEGWKRRWLRRRLAKLNERWRFQVVEKPVDFTFSSRAIAEARLREVSVGEIKKLLDAIELEVTP